LQSVDFLIAAYACPSYKKKVAEKISRRTLFKAGAGLAIAGAAAAIVATECAPDPPKPPLPSVYALSDSSSDYGAIENTLRTARQQNLNIGRLILAFAVPVAGEPYVQLPELPDDLIHLFKSVPEDTGLAISIGGGDYHQAEQWQIRPDLFGIGTKNAVNTLSRIFGREVSAVDLDCEAPLVSGTIDELAGSIRSSLPNHKLTLAVPAKYDPGRYAQNRFSSSAYNVMSYDENGRWSKGAGRLASRHLVMEAAKGWSKKVGDADLSLGFPTYGILFAGASKFGDEFDPERTRPIAYPDIPQANAVDNAAEGYSYAVTDTGIIAFQSIRDIRQNLKAARDEVDPRIGTFFWSASGLTVDHLRAVQP
jgi:hypothetical protein